MKKKEIRIFYEWSVRNIGNNNYFPVNRNTESYFIEHTGDEYITEYGFDTIVMLKTQLEYMWMEDLPMKEILNLVAVSAIKNYKRSAVEKEKKDVLDEFIYTF